MPSRLSRLIHLQKTKPDIPKIVKMGAGTLADLLWKAAETALVLDTGSHGITREHLTHQTECMLYLLTKYPVWLIASESGQPIANYSIAAVARSLSRAGR